MRRLVLLLVAACGGPNITHGKPDSGSGGGSDGSNGFACDPNLGLTCNQNNVVECNPDGTYGAVQQMCGVGTMCTGGVCTNACTADGVDLVYVVDEQNDFMSFDPRKLPANPFTMIGTLACPDNGNSI